MKYTKLYADTVVSFEHFGMETRLDRESCLKAISNIEARRDSYATQESYERMHNIYVGAAVFMGWIEPSVEVVKIKENES